MRILLSFASILVVLLIVVLVARKQLHAVAPETPAAAAAAPVGNDPAAARNAVSQYQQQINQTLEQGAALRASEVEAADGTRR